MKAKEIYQQGLDKLKEFNVRGVMPALRAANSGSIEDLLNINGCAYYQWIPGVIEILKPKQVVELGGAMGMWSLMVLHKLPLESKLYSITLPEWELEYSYVVDTYSNFVPILGSDLDLNNWPKDLDLKKTDLWFFDALHTPEHLTKELELYAPFFKEGTVILVDDIHSFGLDSVWQELKDGKYGKIDCYDATDPLHYSGYGICVYETTK